MERRLICADGELSIARNKTERYIQFLRKSIEEYSAILNEAADKGIEDVLVRRELQRLSSEVLSLCDELQGAVFCDGGLCEKRDPGCGRCGPIYLSGYFFWRYYEHACRIFLRKQAQRTEDILCGSVRMEVTGFAEWRDHCKGTAAERAGRQNAGSGSEDRSENV